MHYRNSDSVFLIMATARLRCDILVNAGVPILLLAVVVLSQQPTAAYHQYCH
jgi:hypothetical protein